MFVVRRVDVNAMHIDQRLSPVAAKAVNIPGNALVQDVVVPRRVAGFTAEDEGDGGVEKLEGFGPLVGLFGVVFFGELGDLPGAPTFVAEGPVFYLGECEYVEV
jgi:hypothetical protein